MNDLISREALLKDLSYCAPELWQDEEYVKAKIIKQPAVDAAPVVHAEWIEEPDREGHYHCSNCGVVWGVSAMAMKHCPNCTAKMTNSPLWDMEDPHG